MPSSNSSTGLPSADARRQKLKISVVVMLSLMTLLIGLMTILVGCSPTQPQEPAPKPTRPTLNIIRMPDGGMCLDKHNTELLGIYIMQLEACGNGFD